MTVEYLNGTNLPTKVTPTAAKVNELVDAVNLLDGGTLPAGGATGQVLTKESSADGDADWEDAGSYTSPLLKATKHLTSANILSLNTVPVQVVAAPGAGFAIFPIDGTAVYRAGTPYAGTSHHLMMTTATLAALNLSLIEIRQAGDFMLTSETDLFVSFGNAANSDVTYPQAAVTAVDNAPLLAYITGSNPTTGTGTVDLTVFYTIIDLVP
jgi:hypothetical protein